ncbi:hypothetical protein D3C87_1625710 [compost metagenome]
MASHHVKGRVTELQRVGHAVTIFEAPRKAPGIGDPRCLANPGGLAIDAHHMGFLRQGMEERTPPMPNAAAHIEDLTYLSELPSAAHELQKIGIPPIVAGIAEKSGRMQAGHTFMSCHRISPSKRMLTWPLLGAAKGRGNRVNAP